MPSVQAGSRQSKSPATGKSTNNPQNSGSVNVARQRKKAKNAPRDDGTTKVETKTLLDDLTTVPPPPEEPDCESGGPENGGPENGGPENDTSAHCWEPSPPKPFKSSSILDSLGTFHLGDNNDAPSCTDNWTKAFPFEKSSPVDNLKLIDGISPGDSPPNLLPEEPRSQFDNSPFSASSPTGKFQPSTYSNGYLGFTPSSSQPSDRQQRNSLPPAPRVPFSAPEIETKSFSVPSPRPSTAGAYTFCAFDTLPSSPRSKFGQKALLVGKDGCLEVLSVEQDKTRVLGKLNGLSGRVVEAKMLTWTSKFDPFASSRPHVAITLHGQADPSGFDDHQPEITSSSSDKQGSSQMQTSVHVFSLRTQKHVATLLAMKPVSCVDNFLGYASSIPGPTGSLRLHASGNYFVISSGTSGEVYIYTATPSSDSGVYQCLGKIWASIQPQESRRPSNSSASTEVEEHPEASKILFDAALLSLSGRWLAIVPPSLSNKVSLQPFIPPELTKKRPYGLESHTPPARPSVSAMLDCEGESFWNRAARGVAQEVFRSAKWIGEQGYQTWNSYWTKDQQPMQTPALRRPVSMDVPSFPPTHASESQSTNEPDLVSIIDLKRLEDGYDSKSSFPTPIATFQPPNGCGFLSLSPSGLYLLTASKKGDVQDVWDLMQVRYRRSKAFINDEIQLPVVRQVSQYSRYSPSTIVDIIWTGPSGEHLAIVTKKGTVHVFDMPRSSFQWPPPRRIVPTSVRNHRTSFPGGDVEEGTGRKALTAAMKFVGGTGRPIFDAVRGRNRAPSAGSTLSGSAALRASAAVGVRGSKVVAAGLTNAATGAVNTIIHARDNKLHLPYFAQDAVPSRVTFLGTEHEPILAVIDGHYLKTFQIWRTESSPKNKKQAHSVIGTKRMVETRLPSIIQPPNNPEPLVLRPIGQPISGFWALPSVFNMSPRNKSPPLSEAEIDSNSPYQPFHTDRRVTLTVYAPGYDAASAHSGTWVFGNPMPTVNMNVRPAADSDSEDADDLMAPGMETDVINMGNSIQEVEQLVITTRRKKRHGPNGGRGDDEWFEDGCDILDFAGDRV